MKPFLNYLIVVIIGCVIADKIKAQTIAFDLVGTWTSFNHGKKTNDSSYTIESLNLTFLNSNALCFDVSDSNPLNKIVYQYNIDTVHGILVLSFHMTEVATTHKMILTIVDRDTINLIDVDSQNNDNPLKSLTNENANNAWILTRKREKKN